MQTQPPRQLRRLVKVNDDISKTKNRWGVVKQMMDMAGKEILADVFTNVAVSVEGGYHFCREDVSEID